MDARDAQASIYIWKMRASHCFFVVILYSSGAMDTGTATSETPSSSSSGPLSCTLRSPTLGQKLAGQYSILTYFRP
jgi:hypothetical protein